MRHVIPKTAWVDKLAQLIIEAENGDEFVFHSEDARYNAKRLHQYICPNKQLTFVVRDDA